MAQEPPITEKHRKSTGCTHENTIIRSLLLWQDAVLRGSTRRHDGLHVDLQRRRRFFCVQLRGKGPLCHRQPDDAPFHRPDGPGLHDGDRGERGRRAGLGRGQEGSRQPLFFTLGVHHPHRGGIITLLGQIGLPKIAAWLGARGPMLDDCILYGRITLGRPAVIYVLQSVFQSFFVTAEKPKLGLFFTVAAGVSNIVLDALFVMTFRWGLAGAAAATVVTQAVGGLGPLVYSAPQRQPAPSLRFCTTIS